MGKSVDEDEQGAPQKDITIITKSKLEMQGANSLPLALPSLATRMHKHARYTHSRIRHGGLNWINLFGTDFDQTLFYIINRAKLSLLTDSDQSDTGYFLFTLDAG